MIDRIRKTATPAPLTGQTGAATTGGTIAMTVRQSIKQDQLKKLLLLRFELQAKS